MLLSMTGFGNALRESESAYVSIELKAVNNRYLKVSMRLPDVIARFESNIEKLVRENIARGAIQLSFRVRLTSQSSGYSIDRTVLDAYLQQLAEVTKELPAEKTSPVVLSDLLQLPGVVSESELSVETVESVWPILEAALRETLDHFQDFRRTEGESMLQDLTLQCNSIEQQVDEVEKHAPVVVSEYRENGPAFHAGRPRVLARQIRQFRQTVRTPTQRLATAADPTAQPAKSSPLAALLSLRLTAADMHPELSGRWNNRWTETSVEHETRAVWRLVRCFLAPTFQYCFRNER